MKNRTRKAIGLLIATVTLAGTALPVRAAEGQEDKWQFSVGVPLWAPQIDGNATVRGNRSDVDISFEELKDHLDASLSLGLDARKGKFGLYGGFGYMKFSADGPLPLGGHADSDLKFLIVEAGVSYLLLKTDEEHPFILEAKAGIRYWHTETDLKIKDGLGAVIFNGGKDRDLEDPVFGLRGSKFLTRKLHLDFAGDVGGFGISDSQADLDWSAAGLVSYDFAKWFSLSGGYKALALDASKGSGANKNGVDIVMHGVLIVATFKF